MPKKLTQEEFIAKAVAAHGLGRYDYSQAVYINRDTRIKIICPTHGEFYQLAGNHLLGKGCQKCKGEVASKKFSGNTKDFITAATIIHNNKYNYDKVNYQLSRLKVVITCLAHGDFEQKPNNHLSGYGCPSCGAAHRGALSMHDTPYFIKRAQAIHGETYSYANVVYSGNSKKVEIICSIHGKFNQSPASHWSGQGCPWCSKESRKISWILSAGNRLCSLYFLRIYDSKEEFYKIGITYNSISVRYRGRRNKLNNYNYEIIACHKLFNPTAIWDWEQSIIQTFSHLSYRPKRAFDGASECFSSANEILAIFPL